MKLESLVNDFQDNNEEYMKITKTVEEKVCGVLSNAKVLLRYALLSITESIRNNPERYRLVFYNMSSQQSRHPSQDYNTEAIAAMIIEEAEKLYNKVVKDCINKSVEEHTNKTITDVASDSESSSLPRTELSDVQKESTQKLAAYNYRKEVDNEDEDN